MTQTLIIAIATAASLLLTSPISAQGKTTYEYDEAGRVVSVTYRDGSGINYEYDPAGNRVGAVERPPTEGADAGHDPDTGRNSDASGEEGGCNCRTIASGTEGEVMLIALLFGAAASFRRRRRFGSSRRGD